jgi:DNA-binding CsgD family transcriptional regulator
VADTPAAATNGDGPDDVAGSAQVLLVVDDEGVCVEASLGACLLLGTSRAEVINHALGELLEPASRERLAAHWSVARRHGGHGGIYALGPPASIEVQMTVTPELLPGRHLIAFGLATEADPGGHGRFQAPSGRAPTAREREVLDLLADGATDEQIAARLAVSPATVQSHIRTAKAKLGARTRAQAVALALQRGLIGAPH